MFQKKCLKGRNLYGTKPFRKILIMIDPNKWIPFEDKSIACGQCEKGSGREF